MSRSYKKFPCIKDHSSCKWGKKYANRRVRRSKETFTKGMKYKRLYQQYDICDYFWTTSLQELAQAWWDEELILANGGGGRWGLHRGGIVKMYFHNMYNNDFERYLKTEYRRYIKK